MGRTILSQRSAFSREVRCCLAALFSCLSTAFSLSASEADWTLRRFVPPQGTNFEEVRDIVVTGEDGIWFSSWGNGVAQLQGSEWKLFSVADRHLPSDFVPSLAWDAENRTMWAGTDAGLVALVGEQAFSVPLPEGLVDPGFEITFIYRFPDGELWIGGRKGTVVSIRPTILVSESRVIVAEPKRILASGGHDGFVVRGILEAQDGSRWVARNRGGVTQYRGGEWITHLSDVIGCERSDVLFEAQDGRIWVSGAGQPCAFDGESWVQSPHEIETKFFTQLDDGNYYLGSDEGKVFVDTESVPSGSPLNAWNDVTISRIRAMAILNDALLWVGAKEGILLGTRPRWRERGARAAGAMGSDLLGFFCSDDQWPLSLRKDGMLMEFQSESDSWEERFQLPLGNIDQPMISAPRDDLCWVRSGPEVLQLNLATEQVVSRLTLPDDFEIRDLAMDLNGRFYVVGENGGYHLEGREWVRSLGDKAIFSIGISRNGDLLLALSNDLQRWRNGEKLQEWKSNNRNPNHAFTFVAESQDGSILAGTRGLGLKVFGEEGEQTVSVRDHLLSSRILSAYQVPGGALWIGFDNLGVAVRQDDRWVNYSAADGLEGGEFHFISRDPAGDVWTSKLNSKVYRYEGDQGRPKTTITDAAPVVSSGETIVFGFEGYDAWGHTPEPELEFSWRLVKDELDQAIPGEWSPYSPDRAVSIIQGLSAGRYAFEVRAQDRDFNVDSSPARHIFEVLPPIWARSSVFVPIGLLSALAIGLTLRLIVERGALRRHRDRLNEEVHRRTEELEEANASLSAEKERLMVTLQSIGDGIVVINTKREIVVFNPDH